MTASNTPLTFRRLLARLRDALEELDDLPLKADQMGPNSDTLRRLQRVYQVELADILQGCFAKLRDLHQSDDPEATRRIDDLRELMFKHLGHTRLDFDARLLSLDTGRSLTQVYQAYWWFVMELDRLVEALVVEYEPADRHKLKAHFTELAEQAGQSVGCQETGEVFHPAAGPSYPCMLWYEERSMPHLMRATGSHRDLSDLNPTQREVWTYVRDKGPVQGDEIAHVCSITASHFRNHIVPALKPYGLRNDRKNGYYIEAEGAVEGM